MTGIVGVPGKPGPAALIFTSDGWVSGQRKPTKVGPYDRRSFLGIRVDWWDGTEWRLRSAGGIACANQELEWRAQR